MTGKMRIAILDDYQNVALTMADWNTIQQKTSVTVFNHPLTDPATQLREFEAICIMRERTPFNVELLRQLPYLALIVSTGKRNLSLDMEACRALNIEVRMTGYLDHGAPEMTWALLTALAKNIVQDSENMRNGGWQTTVNADLKGKTLGLLGLGRVGQKMAQFARAFDMNVIAWSQHLTVEQAAEADATWVSKEDLLRQADFLSVHLVLSERNKGIVGAADLALMQPGAFFINTSRGPLVEEEALIQTLAEKRIRGAALDVYDKEPLPADHPFRILPNVLATPHTGYVTQDTYKMFFGDTVRELEQWMLEQETADPAYMAKYHQPPEPIYQILKKKDIRQLFHANTVATALTFIEQGALLSRHEVESKGLFQTPQDSDEKDKRYGIWDDVFIDGVDNHFQHKRHNVYGPVLFVLKPELLLELGDHPLLVTRYNPQYCDNFPTWKSRYILDTAELERDYKSWQNDSSRMMFTIPSCGKHISLAKYLHEIIVERVNYHIGEGEKKREIAVAVRDRLRQALNANGLEQIPVRLKHEDDNFGDCNCLNTYQEEIEKKEAWFRRKFSANRDSA
jgi:phosphoglycerate dehydrogenase-like enzyme